MRMLFIEYPTCSTCRKAKKYLQDAGMELEIRHIVEETPTVEELRAWVKQSGLELKNFFNTSGNVYKELKLKDRLKELSEEEQLNLLAGNGMLIKRPLLICEKGLRSASRKRNIKIYVQNNKYVVY